VLLLWEPAFSFVGGGRGAGGGVGGGAKVGGDLVKVVRRELSFG